jgi:cobalt/nickel transport system permease protein
MKQPAGGRSLLHPFDARVKVAASLVFAVSVAVAQEWVTLGALLGVALALAFFSGLSPGSLVRRLAALDGVLLMLWITLPLSGGGEKVLLGGVPISVEGVATALAITIRAHAGVIGFLALLGTTPPHEFMRALRLMGVPQKLVLLFHFTYRYSHVIFEESARIHTSMMLRGFAPKPDLHTLKTYGNLMGNIFLRSFRRAERVTEAMELRGFTADFPTVEIPAAFRPVHLAGFAVFFLLVVWCFFL